MDKIKRIIKKKIIFLTESEVRYSSNTALKSRLGISVKDGEDALADLFIDCDKLRIPRDDIIISFMEVDFKEKIYIISWHFDYIISRYIKCIITRFFQTHWQQYFNGLHSDWDTYWACKYPVIAYRGGSGYVHAMWAYNGRNV